MRSPTVAPPPNPVQGVGHTGPTQREPAGLQPIDDDAGVERVTSDGSACRFDYVDAPEPRRVIPISEAREARQTDPALLARRARHEATARQWLSLVSDGAVAATPACMIGSRAESEAYEDGVKARRAGLATDVCRFSGDLGDVWMHGYCGEPDGAA